MGRWGDMQAIGLQRRKKKGAIWTISQCYCMTHTGAAGLGFRAAVLGLGDAEHACKRRQNGRLLW